MGCICSKATAANDYVEKESKKSSKRLTASSRRDGVVVEVDIEATTRLISNGKEDEGQKKTVVYQKSSIQQAPRPGNIDNGGSDQPGMCRLFSIKDGVDGSQAAAGWPSWLTAVAGEAIKGWLPRKADSFEKLDKIGQGTYSSVYRARDLETGKIVALKKVRFVNMDPESVRFMAREIIVLRRLDHPNVMKLEGLITSRVSGNLYLVFEYMEHDLAGLAASPMIKFTESQIKCYMEQLLRGLEHCHNRGILHRDIKGSNLLMDNDGNLKIGDFGLATVFRSNQKHPLTSRVVTLWYRPPELLLGATDYGVAVDLWSAGCILAELFAGKPIMPGRTEVEQLHKIFKLCGSPSEEYWRKSKLPHATIFKPQHPYKRSVADTFKDFPPSALSLLESLLAVEPENRGSTSSALQSEFFTTTPLPCHPSSLPKYPPSKEYDVRVRDDETRRNKSGAGKARGLEYSRKGTRESRGMPAPDSNAELQASIQKRLDHHNPKSNNEKFNPKEEGAMNMEESELGFNSAQHSKYQGAHLSKFSNSVAGHGGSKLDLSNGSTAYSHYPNGKYHQLNDADSSHHTSNSYHKKHQLAPGKEGYAWKKNRMHYSGPLLAPGGNMEEMLKEHEKQIQHAVRKARLENANTKTGFGKNALMESLLQYS